MGMDAVGVFTIPAGTRFRRHEHVVPHVVAVLAGGFVERESGGWQDVGPGTIRVSGAAQHDCAGFADQSHLTRAMRSAWGVTPGALRRDVTGVQDPAGPRSTRSARRPVS